MRNNLYVYDIDLKSLQVLENYTIIGRDYGMSDCIEWSSI